MKESFHRNETYPKKFETIIFLPKMSSICGLALHACDFLKNYVFQILGTFGDWMVILKF